MSLRSARWEALVVGAILALAVGASRAAAQEPDGAALYQQNCRTCHGVKGVPPARMTAVYANLKPFSAANLPEDSIVAVLKNGRGKDMKSFADRLSAAQMTAVAKFVRTLSTAPASQ